MYKHTWRCVLFCACDDPTHPANPHATHTTHTPFAPEMRWTQLKGSRSTPLPSMSLMSIEPWMSVQKRTASSEAPGPTLMPGHDLTKLIVLEKLPLSRRDEGMHAHSESTQCVGPLHARPEVIIQPERGELARTGQHGNAVEHVKDRV